MSKQIYYSQQSRVCSYFTFFSLSSPHPHFSPSFTQQLGPSISAWSCSRFIPVKREFPLLPKAHRDNLDLNRCCKKRWIGLFWIECSFIYPLNSQFKRSWLITHQVQFELMLNNYGVKILSGNIPNNMGLDICSLACAKSADSQQS